MKVKYLFIGLALACLLGACNRDEASLFDKSAAQRAQEALDNAESVLAAAENGWEMLYFANDKDGMVIGYNILVKFDKNGKVTATAKNSITTGNKLVTDSSTWVVLSDYGPILSFDTYNKVLHAWADPQSDGDGFLGDYEFMIVQADADYIKLKGKKHGGYEYGDWEAIYCYMYALKEATDAATYFSDVEAMKTKLFGNDNLLMWNDTKETYMLNYGSTGYFELTKPGVGFSDDDEFYPFATTRTGIQLCNGIHQNTDVVFKAETNRLLGETSTITVGALDTYFYNYVYQVGAGWALSSDTMCTSVKTAYDAANTEIKTVYKNQKKGGITSMKFGKHATKDLFVLAFSYIGSGSKASTFNYTYTMERVNGHIKLTYLEPVDENAGKIITALPTVETLLKSLDGDYILTPDDALNPSMGTMLKDNTNSGLWLYLTGSN